MDRTLEKSRLKMEVKQEPPDQKFQAWVNHAQTLVEKYPHKNTAWVARQLANYIKAHNMPAWYYRLHHTYVDEQWVVSLHSGRIILPYVLIYVETKTEEVA